MAAASPVIIDDGGSTRIKQIRDSVSMDHLLDLLTDEADGAFVNGAGVFQCKMKVRFHEHDGDQHIPVGNHSLNIGDVVEIVSENQQVVRLSFDSDTKKLRITLASNVTGVRPVVEAKQQNLQRRYVVSNAGAIASVTVNPGTATAVQVYPPPGGGPPSVSTMIHLTA